MSSYEVRELPAGVLPEGPVAGMETEPGSVTLELPGRGRITVSGAQVLIEASSPVVAERMRAEFDGWIRGQQWCQAGFLVFSGACVQQDGRAIVLATRPRGGASMAALGLVQAGWQLVSDGVSGIRAVADRLAVVPGSSSIEVDAEVAPAEPWRVYPCTTGAPRVRIHVPHCTEEIEPAAIMVLLPRANAVDIDTALADADVASVQLARLRVPDLSGPARVDDLPSRVAAAVPLTMLQLPVRTSTPASVAEAVVKALGPVGVA